MKHRYRQLAFWLGPGLAACVGIALNLGDWSFAASATGAVTAWCAIWWVFEPVPIPVTSLLPMGLLPLLGALPPASVAAAYGSPLILLLLGGFILSTALERSGAHRRLALGMVNLLGGGSDRKLVLGFMLASAALSMWISNTATTLMLMPVILAILAQADHDRLRLPLILGVAYGASIGGLGTPIGTPPNLIFISVFNAQAENPVSFVGWMQWGLPVVIVFIPAACWWLTRKLKGSSELIIPKAGSWDPAERRVLIVFACTALAWMTRTAPFGGWQSWLDLTTANDAAVALVAVVVMFCVSDGKGGRLLDWETANRIPWGVLLLFAGGITIANGFVATGLSEALGEALARLTQWPHILLVLMLALSVTFLTEVTSNTATTSLLMPILAAAGISAGINPALLMVPAAMSASCAFMLPVATAPNAIAYGTQKVTIEEMMREGLALNMIGAVIITLACTWYFTV